MVRDDGGGRGRGFRGRTDGSGSGSETDASESRRMMLGNVKIQESRVAEQFVAYWRWEEKRGNRG